MTMFMPPTPFAETDQPLVGYVRLYTAQLGAERKSPQTIQVYAYLLELSRRCSVGSTSTVRNGTTVEGGRRGMGRRRADEPPPALALPLVPGQFLGRCTFSDHWNQPATNGPAGNEEIADAVRPWPRG